MWICLQVVYIHSCTLPHIVYIIIWTREAGVFFHFSLVVLSLILFCLLLVKSSQPMCRLIHHMSRWGLQIIFRLDEIVENEGAYESSKPVCLAPFPQDRPQKAIDICLWHLHTWFHLGASRCMNNAPRVILCVGGLACMCLLPCLIICLFNICLFTGVENTPLFFRQKMHYYIWKKKKSSIFVTFRVEQTTFLKFVTMCDRKLVHKKADLV